METAKRSIARKISVSDLVSGTFIKRPGWEPSVVLTKYGEISRVNVVGLIVSITQSDNSGTFLLDDGTGNITVRYFENRPEYNSLKLGDLIRLIGRVRENQSTVYLVPEIIKQVGKEWHTLHGAELKLQKKIAVKLPVEKGTEEMEVGPYQKVLNVIAMLDKGDGAYVDEIISASRIEDGDKVMKALISEGEIFEISPGKVKLLE